MQISSPYSSRGWQRVENLEAPVGYGRGERIYSSLNIPWRSNVLTPSVELFFNESDSSVAAYNSALYGNNNSRGYLIGFEYLVGGYDYRIKTLYRRSEPIEADGINSVWCVVTEVIDDEYVRVTNRFNSTPSTDYWGSSSASLNEPVASSSAVVFQGAGDVVYTTFSAKSWLNFATTNDYDVDASGAFSLEVDDLNYITRPYIHIFIEGPYINDSASENIAENISASYQFVYKG